MPEQQSLLGLTPMRFAVAGERAIYPGTNQTSTFAGSFFVKIASIRETPGQGVGLPGRILQLIAEHHEVSLLLTLLQQQVPPVDELLGPHRRIADLRAVDRDT